MITRNGIFLVAFLGFFSAVYSDMKCPGVAHYELSFWSMWSNDTHPNAFPDMGKFSNWVGASHNMYYTIWDAGILATKGVEDVAETGELIIETPLSSTLVVSSAQLKQKFVGS